MKFARHLAAASVLVMIVVGLGFLWRISGAAGLVADGQDHHGDIRPFPGGPPKGPPRFGRHFDRGQGANLSDPSDLIQTLVTVGGVVVGVVLLDAAWRRRTIRERVPART